MTHDVTLRLITIATTRIDPVPDDNDVVAGWGAFALFGLGILAVALLGFSLVNRLKNTDRAAAQGLYDPSDPKPTDPRRPARGLAAGREMREQAARDQAEAAERAPGEGTRP